MTARYRIMIGLLENDPVWAGLLDQIGVPWEYVGASHSFSHFEYSVLIVNGTLNKKQKDLCDKYIYNGGSICHDSLTENAFVQFTKRSRTYYSSIAPQQNVPWGSEPFDVHDTITCVDDSILTYYSVKGTGNIAYLGLNISKLYRTVTHKRKNFHALKRRLPNEVVRTQSLAQARRLIFSALVTLHEKRGLPFLHHWYFPQGRQNLFTFRIDSDLGSQQEIDDLYSLSAKYDIPTMWFLDVKSHEEWLEYFKKFKRQEIGIHCYEHRVSHSYDINNTNFQSASRLLRNAHLPFTGYAAPQGKWNISLQRMYEDLNVPFSSEFQYSYDDFPIYPLSTDGLSPVVQIPIHPICPGSLRRAGYSSQEMIDYYTTYCDKQIALQEPICLYHHPTHHYTEVFDTIFKYLREKNVAPISYSEYAGWWNSRIAQKIRATFDMDSQELHFHSDIHSNIAVWRDRENRYMISDEGSSSIKNLQFEHVEPYEPPHDSMRTRKFDPRHYIINTLELWYSVRP